MAIHNNREGRELLERVNVGMTEIRLELFWSQKRGVCVSNGGAFPFRLQQFRNLLRIALFISLHTGKCSGGGLRN